MATSALDHVVTKALAILFLAMACGAAKNVSIMGFA